MGEECKSTKAIVATLRSRVMEQTPMASCPVAFRVLTNTDFHRPIHFDSPSSIAFHFFVNQELGIVRT